MSEPTPILQGRYLTCQREALATTCIEKAPGKYVKATMVLADLPEKAQRRYAPILGKGIVSFVATAADDHFEGDHDAARSDNRIHNLFSVLKRLCQMTAPDPIGPVSLETLTPCTQSNIQKVDGEEMSHA